jgi:hypothetical protein
MQAKDLYVRTLTLHNLSSSNSLAQANMLRSEEELSVEVRYVYSVKIKNGQVLEVG